MCFLMYYIIINLCEINTLSEFKSFVNIERENSNVNKSFKAIEISTNYYIKNIIYNTTLSYFKRTS